LFKEIWVFPALDYIECTQKQNNGKLTKTLRLSLTIIRTDLRKFIFYWDRRLRRWLGYLTIERNIDGANETDACV